MQEPSCEGTLSTVNMTDDDKIQVVLFILIWNHMLAIYLVSHLWVLLVQLFFPIVLLLNSDGRWLLQLWRRYVAVVCRSCSGR